MRNSKTHKNQTQSENNAGRPPAFRVIGNVRPDDQKPYWHEYGALWTRRDDQPGYVLKLHALPFDPAMPLLIVPVDAKAQS